MSERERPPLLLLPREYRIATSIALMAVLSVALGCSGRAVQPVHGVLVGEKARPVAPGQVFGGQLLQVLAPASPGWVLLQDTSAELTFARPGAAARETYVATVSFFELPATEGRDAFVAYIRQARERDSPPERFADARVTYEYAEDRGYPCVMYASSALDRNAPGGALKLVERGAYCRHPLREGLGFWVSYSQRALLPDANLTEQANGFAQGVTVPHADLRR